MLRSRVECWIATRPNLVIRKQDMFVPLHQLERDGDRDAT
jgi:hypothetical protein